MIAPVVLDKGWIEKKLLLSQVDQLFHQRA